MASMFDLEAAYWTLSTIAQVVVALVAFLGLLGVWRLDSLSRLREEARQLLLRIQEVHRGTRNMPTGYDDQSLIEMADGLETGAFPKTGFQTHQIEFPRKQLQQALSIRRDVSSDLRRLTVSGMITTAACLLGLGFLPWIILIPTVALPYFVLIAAGTVWTFWNAGHLVFQALVRPEH